MKERKELFCGSWDECGGFVKGHAHGRLMEIIATNMPGPAAQVFWKKAPGAKALGEKPVEFETRESVHVKGLDSRPLIVSLNLGDTITFRPKGTRQEITVPIISLYHQARFTAARALASAKRKRGTRAA